MKIHSPDKLILGHLNINSIRNKFDSLIYMPDKNVDIFLISEMKLNDPFPWKVSPTLIVIIETIKKVTFYYILGRTFHHVYRNANYIAL